MIINIYLNKIFVIGIIVIFLILGFYHGTCSSEIFTNIEFGEPKKPCYLTSQSQEMLTQCFNKGPGDVLISINTLPSATLTPIDYDHDGDIDFITGIHNDIYIVTKENNNYYSSFFCKLPDKNGYSEDLSAGGMTSADFNNDGYEDFITGGVQGMLRLFLNNYSRSNDPLFNTIILAELEQSAYGLASADFNNDGLVDFAVSHATAPFNYSLITIFYNEGNLKFIRQDVYIFNYSYISDLNIVDYDNDGYIDIFLTYNIYKWHIGLPINVIGITSVLPNLGNNTFSGEEVIIKRGSDLLIGGPLCLSIWLSFRRFIGIDRINPHITSADYDMDGDIDFLVGDNSGKIEFFLNDGTGEFTSNSVIHDFGSFSWGLASADFDSDGDIDFIVAAEEKFNSLKGHIWLIYNNII